MAAIAHPTDTEQRERTAPVPRAPAPVQWLAPLTGVMSVALVAAALLLAATAATALRTCVLPAWLSWLSVPLALWLLVPPFGSPAGTDWAPPAWSGLGALVAVPLWILATAIALTLRSRRR